MSNNEIFNPYEPLWEIGDTIFKENNKIGFNIKHYCLNQLMKQKDKFNDDDTKRLMTMINECKEIQSTMNPVDIHCEKSEYKEFIKKYFEDIETQRKQGVVSIELGNKYKQFSYLLEPYDQYNLLNEKTREIQQFCISTSKEMIDKCTFDYTNNSNKKNNGNVKLHQSNEVIDNNDFPQENEETDIYKDNKSNVNNNPYINNEKEKEKSTKNKYINVSTPKAEEALKAESKVHSNEIYSFSNRQSQHKLYVNEKGFIPANVDKQLEFVKKNNYNAIDEFKSCNIAIAIQLIKNSINTLHTIPQSNK